MARVKRRMRERVFYEMVERALEGLPPELAELLDNVAIVVEDWPERSMLADYEEDTLYGLYEGVPLSERGEAYYGVLPDRISIFRGPLERAYTSPQAIAREVRVTVMHELGHHLGFEESGLESLGLG